MPILFRCSEISDILDCAERVRNGSKGMKLKTIFNSLSMICLTLIIFGAFIFGTAYIVRAQAVNTTIQRVSEYVLYEGTLLGSVAQLDGGNVVISLEKGESAYNLLVTVVKDGFQVDRLTLPWGKPDKISISAAGSVLHVTVGWADSHISAYSWLLSSPVSKEYSIFVPTIP